MKLLNKGKFSFREALSLSCASNCGNVALTLSSHCQIMSSLYLSSFAGAAPYEILLSYVHREASDEAMALREALQVAGYRVFLDVECIRGGSDWQDVLNDAVSNCSVFVPLITQQYGQVEKHHFPFVVYL